MATVRNVAGVSERTVKEAKKQLGVEAERVGGVAGGGHWVWRLAKGAGPKGVGPISEVCTLSANPHANAESEGSETLRGHSQRDNPLRRSGSCECRRPARSPRADGPDFCRTCLRSIGEAS
jgi:hypothetical protein